MQQITNTYGEGGDHPSNIGNRGNEPSFQRSALLVLILLVLAGGTLYITHPPKEENLGDTEAMGEHREEESIFSTVEIEAESAVVWDMALGKPLYEKNPEAQLPLASISKIMTALVAGQLLGRDDQVVIDDLHLRAEGDNGLETGDIWRSADLSDFTLVVSSNDGARALASAATSALPNREMDFIDVMNTTAQRLGLRQTYFLNPSGLDVEETSISGSYGSARDMARLLEYIVRAHPTLLEATRYPSVTLKSGEGSYTAENTNRVLGNLSGVIASKTGFTDLAGGNLAVVFDVGLGHPVAAVVLGSSKEGRFSDIEALYTTTLNYFSGKQ